jgi:hypothetical protein
VTFQGANQPTVLTSPFANDAASMVLYLPKLMDNVTAQEGATIPYRININQCSKVVLSGIMSWVPDIGEDVADAILEARVPQSDDEGLLSNQRHETWLLAYGLITLEQMKSLSPFVCAGGDVYRAQVVGYYQGGGASARAEVVFDATEATPRVLLWRDISHLGRGYPLETLGVQLVEGPSQQLLNPGGL